MLRTLRILTMVIVAIAVALLGTTATISSAQTGTPDASQCQTILPKVRENLATGCAALENDQVCLANSRVNVEFKDNVAAKSFSKPGDIAPLASIQSLRTEPLNLEKNEWGIAVIRARAETPGTTAGQAVTFLLYGDVQIRNGEAAAKPAIPEATCDATTRRTTYLRSTPANHGEQVQLLQANTRVKLAGRSADGEWALAKVGEASGWLFMATLNMACELDKLSVVPPQASLVPAASVPSMRAFSFSTGVSAQPTCKDVPGSGMMVRAPEGQKVAFTANGVDVTVDDTTLLRAVPNEFTRITVMRGTASVSAGGQQVNMTAGEGIFIPVGGKTGLDAVGAPGELRFFKESDEALNTVCELGKAAGLGLPCAAAERCTFTLKSFGTDRNPLKRSATSCTTSTLAWNVEGVQELYLGNARVPLQASQEICVNQNTTYTLRMVCNKEQKTQNFTLRLD